MEIFDEIEKLNPWLKEILPLKVKHLKYHIIDGRTEYARKNNYPPELIRKRHGDSILIKVYDKDLRTGESISHTRFYGANLEIYSNGRYLNNYDIVKGAKSTNQYHYYGKWSFQLYEPVVIPYWYGNIFKVDCPDGRRHIMFLDEGYEPAKDKYAYHKLLDDITSHYEAQLNREGKDDGSGFLLAKP